jgi:hypothetical protein
MTMLQLDMTRRAHLIAVRQPECDLEGSVCTSASCEYLTLTLRMLCRHCKRRRIRQGG